MIVRKFSDSLLSREEVTTGDSDNRSQISLKGYVTVKYDYYWRLQLTVDNSAETGEATVNFLHPHGPAK